MDTNEIILVTKTSMPPYEEYIEAIKPLWDSHWITNMGKYHKALEERLQQFLDVVGLSLMVNGHMALELAIQSFEFPPGSEIITTPFTFISTTHAIVRNGLEPVFCDVKDSDGTIDETKIEDLITDKTVAILPVHVYGNVCNIEAIEQIAYRYNLKVIYDAAHAFGVKYKGKGVGNFGDASVFSFHATKVFNTIEGGAVTFNNPKIYDKLYNLKNFGIRGEETVVSIGANAKMNEFAAIMGLCNLNHVDNAINTRKSICDYYRERLSSVKGIRLIKHSGNQTENGGYFPIIVEDEFARSRDDIYIDIQKKDIKLRKYFYPLTSDQACFKNKYKWVNLDNARNLSRRVLVLPVYEDLTIKEVKKVLDCLLESI